MKHLYINSSLLNRFQEIMYCDKKCFLMVLTYFLIYEQFIYLFIFVETGSGCVAQATLKLLTLPPQPLECYDYSVYHSVWLLT
jgi:hypothetical protein